MSIQLEEDLATGIADIDKHLRKIMKLLQTVDRVDEKNFNAEDIEKMTRCFGGTIIDLFDTEEDYMLRNSFPGYDSHKEQHMKFIKNFESLKKVFQKEHDHALMVSVIKREYSQWLVKHMKTFNKELASFLKTVL
jgi:hemerythrin